MPWRIDESSVEARPDGSSTTSVTETNDAGDQRTTTVERDANGNEVRREVDRRNADGSETHTLDQTLPDGTRVNETRTSDAQGNETTDRTETDPAGGTKRTRTSITMDRGRIRQKREEFEDGVRRYRRETTTYPRTGDEFINEMWWDEKGKAYRKRHRHNKDGVEQFDYDHALPLAMHVPFDLYEGGLIMVTHAGAGSALGGYVDPSLYGAAHRVRIRSAGRCAAAKPDACGSFQLPPGATSEGEAVVEVVDGQGKVTVSRTVLIGPAEAGHPEVASIDLMPGREDLLVARGVNLAAMPETADQFETWAGPLVLFRSEPSSEVVAPIAWSDQEILFRASSTDCLAAVHDGAGGTSELVKCPLKVREFC